MPTLRRHHAGHLESEYMITASELALAFQLRAGRITRHRAFAHLRDWRWSPADAEKFLDLIEEIGTRL